MNLSNNIKEYEDNIKVERELWNEYISKGLIMLPSKCPKCKKNLAIIENNSPINSYLGRCSSPKTQKNYIFKDKYYI